MPVEECAALPQPMWFLWDLIVGCRFKLLLSVIPTHLFLLQFEEAQRALKVPMG